MLSQQLIKELQEIINKEFGKNLEISEVAEIGNNLVDYYDLLTKINHEEKMQKQPFNKIE